MITKFILIIWIGAGQTQTLHTQTFDTIVECDAVAETLKIVIDRPSGWYKCEPYSFEGE
jgi:hypothetical protein